MYIQPGENRLYAVGKSHTYVFEIDESFMRILHLSRSLSFSPYLEDFALSKDNSVRGSVNLWANVKKLTKGQRTELIKLGFKSVDRDIMYRYDTEIKGTRYLSSGELPLQKFKKEIPAGIELPDSRMTLAKKIALTPATVATDVCVSLPAGVLLVLVIATDSL